MRDLSVYMHGISKNIKSDINILNVSRGNIKQYGQL